MLGRRLLTILLAFAVLAIATGPAVATTRSHQLVIYSVAEQQQYINNSDARRAGAGPNPFGNYNDVAPSTKNAKGPFPGDEALFSFNLYTTAGLSKRTGTAIFTCQYNFKSNAFCDASYKLTGRGSLTASGSFNFNATSFTLAVTGGDGAFAGRSGYVQVAPTARQSQRVTFVLG